MGPAAPRLVIAVATAGLLLPSELFAGRLQQTDPPLIPPDPGTAPAQQVPAALWGRVTLTDGDVVEGFLRWDRNETTTADVLDGNRLPSDEGLRLRRAFSDRSADERRRSVELPGVRVTWEEEEDFETLVQAGVRFGWIERIVPDGSNAIVHLRGGASIELRSASTDIGPAFRGLEVEEADGSLRSLSWSVLSEVRLLAPPIDRVPARTRLHGTVETDRGLRFTGWIAWDAETTFVSDPVAGGPDGADYAGVTRIERHGRSMTITRNDGGDPRTLPRQDAGGNPGVVEVSDPGVGRVRVNWDDFASIRLHPAPPDAAIPVDGGGSLRGSVETESDRVISGRVVWDLDESEGWHVLDGEADGVDMDIEFSRIARIEKTRGGEGVIVTLLDGRTFELEGSNDVNAENRGIVVITDAGDEQLVEWAGFRLLTLGGG